MLPTPEQWQEQVRAALRSETSPRLQWTRRDAARWDLHGDCPHCGHYMSVLAGDVVVSDSAFESGTLIELLAECSCDPGHAEGRLGCGAGRGAYITMRAPRQPTA